MLKDSIPARNSYHSMLENAISRTLPERERRELVIEGLDLAEKEGNRKAITEFARKVIDRPEIAGLVGAKLERFAQDLKDITYTFDAKVYETLAIECYQIAGLFIEAALVEESRGGIEKMNSLLNDEIKGQESSSEPNWRRAADAASKLNDPKRKNEFHEKEAEDLIAKGRYGQAGDIRRFEIGDIEGSNILYLLQARQYELKKNFLEAASWAERAGDIKLMRHFLKVQAAIYLQTQNPEAFQLAAQVFRRAGEPEVSDAILELKQSLKKTK